MSIWIITIAAQNFFRSYTIWKHLLVILSEGGERIYQKAVTKGKLKKKGDCMFRRNGPLLCLKWREKKDVTMLTTIHEVVMVETGRRDILGEKIEKPEAVYHRVVE